MARTDKPQPMTGAIITGDLIESSAMTPSDIQTLLQELREALGTDVVQLKEGAIFQYRGDGFQLMCLDATKGVTLMLMIKAWLKHQKHIKKRKLEARMFLGLGQVTLAASLGSSGGEAFIRSGRGLDNLNAPHTLGLDLGQQRPELERLLELLDELSRHWKPMQAQTIFYLLQGKRYSEIAKILAKQENTVSKTGRSIGWPLIKHSIAYIEQALKV